jgi:hypothetical protein
LHLITLTEAHTHTHTHTHAHIHTHTPFLGRAALDEGSACRRDLYLTTHTIHKRQESIPQAGFEGTFPTSEGPQTHVLDRAATGRVLSNNAKLIH